MALFLYAEGSDSIVVGENSISLEIRPITYQQVRQFIIQYHQHHGPPQSCKFCVGAFVGGKMVACAVCGRPASRMLDNGETCEISRLCSDGTLNACSFLYEACCRIAKAMGYKRMITHMLISENGASLGVNILLNDGIAGGINWTGSRDRGQKWPAEMKNQWVKYL